MMMVAKQNTNATSPRTKWHLLTHKCGVQGNNTSPDPSRRVSFLYQLKRARSYTHGVALLCFGDKPT